MSSHRVSHKTLQRGGGQTGTRPIFEGAAGGDLELLESRTLDGPIQELIYRPTRLTTPKCRPGQGSEATDLVAELPQLDSNQ